MGIFSTIYGIALSGRKYFYKTGVIKAKKLPVKVISIGNLTLGGTGKTPAVIAIAQEAKRRGFNPCILTRGYKGKTEGPCFVGMGEGPLLNAHEAGDEPVLMAERLEGIPIVMDRCRYRAGMFAIKNSPASHLIDTFILDDGFQHIALCRDTDVLLIDAANPFGNWKLFPEGILREKLSSMKRADIIVISNSCLADEEAVASTIRKIRIYNPGAPVYRASHYPDSLVSLTGETRSANTLLMKKVSAFSGIANPSYFKAALASKGANIIKFRSFKDHFFYHQRDINKIIKDAAGLEIITTEKDLVKLRELDLPESIAALRIEFSVESGFFDQVLTSVKKV